MLQVQNGGFGLGTIGVINYSGTVLTLSVSGRTLNFTVAALDANALVSPTAGSTVTIDPTLGNLYKWTAGENETVNISGTQVAGQKITFMITNDAIVRTITLGTGIVSTGVIVGTALKTAIVIMQSDGTNFYELSRTLGL